MFATNTVKKQLKIKVKVCTLDIAHLRESSPQKRSRTARGVRRVSFREGLSIW